tara:strand:+ start:311 stop:889 length:579 start_codon:yes stop_codon:yes gene_type:complete
MTFGPTGKPIRIKNDAAFQKVMKNFDKVVEDSLDMALLETAIVIQDDAIKNLVEGYNKSTKGEGTMQDPAGAYDTGRLASGFRGIKNEPMRKVVGNNVSYAAHMEYGTGPAIGRPSYKPPAKNLLSWSNRHGFELDNPEMVTSTIMRRGTYPRRYLGGAFHKNKKMVVEDLAGLIEKKISDLAQQQIRVKKR